LKGGLAKEWELPGGGLEVVRMDESDKGGVKKGRGE